MGLRFIINHKTFLADHHTYFPEIERKIKPRIIRDLVMHIFKYGEINQFYFAYGLDNKSCRNAHDYMAYTEFMEKRNRFNCTLPFDYRCLVTDKSLFSIISSAYKIPVPVDLGIMINGKLVDTQEKICNYINGGGNIYQVN